MQNCFNAEPTSSLRWNSTRIREVHGQVNDVGDAVRARVRFRLALGATRKGGVVDFAGPERARAGRIFISYRRDSAAGAARAVANDLDAAFGADTAFMDSRMPGGATWPARLRDELTDAPVVLALIGPEWLTASDEWNRRRIDSPTDWVRQEIETALRNPDTLLIPVLLDGASIPPKEALPDSLTDLADRQARVLSHRTWTWQVDALIEDIVRHTGWHRVTTTVSRRGRDTVETYTRAQLRRVETVLLTDGPAVGNARNPGAQSTEPVVPDLLPFQVDAPVTDGLTADVAEHLRRAVKDRARHSAEDLLRNVCPQRLVVVGGPGSGKTTLFSMITQAHAGAALAAERAADTAMRVPVLLRVRDLSPVGEDSLTAELARDASRWLDLDLGQGFFDELFASGRGMLLVDGVDEAPTVSRRNELLTKIDLFAEKYESATVLVSSRIVGYDPRLLGRNFTHYELAPFSERQVRAVLNGVLGSGAEEVAKRVFADARLSAFVETPLLLSIVARIVVERGTVDRLPRERHALYDVAGEMMLADWDALRGIETVERPRRLEPGEIRQALESVAYRVHAGLIARGSRSVVEAATLEYELTEALGEHTDTRRARWQARELLRYAVIRAGLLVESGPGHFAFCHRAVQEHLAACAIDARGRDEVVRHFAEHGVHEPEWRNVHLLLASMQRGERARAVIEYVLDAGSAHEQWLHRDLLLVGEALGESPALVAAIDDELAIRVASGVLGISTRSRPEVGYLVSQAAVRVLRSWRDTAMKAAARQCLTSTRDQSSPVERHRVEAIVGDVRAAQDALVELIVSADSETADRAAMAVRDLDVELQPTADHVEAILKTIPARVHDFEAGDDTRPPRTAAEVVGLFAREGPSRDRVLSTYTAWLDDEAGSDCLRGAAATGLGWLGENSAEVREALLRMLLDRRISPGDRSWPAYALFRLAGGESAVADAMLTVLEDEAPILCGWAQGYLSNFATRSSEVVARLAELAEDPFRPTLPWVLAAMARLAGLTHDAIGLLETIAVSDPSVARSAGAIEVLVQCPDDSRMASARGATAGRDPAGVPGHGTDRGKRQRPGERHACARLAARGPPSHMGAVPPVPAP